MTRSPEKGPADLAPNTTPSDAQTPAEARAAKRNSFYDGLPPEAKERFLETLAAAADRGLSEEDAWAEALAAVESAYVPDFARDDAPPEP